MGSGAAFTPKPPPLPPPTSQTKQDPRHVGIAISSGTSKASAEPALESERISERSGLLYQSLEPGRDLGVISS